MLRKNACRVAQVSNIHHLQASHMKPWSVPNDQKKLGGSKMLLLSPHIDHFFDQG